MRFTNLQNCAMATHLQQLAFALPAAHCSSTVYCSYCPPIIRDLYHQKYIRQLELIEHRAAYFVVGRPWRRHQRDSITDMLNHGHLEWPTLL